MPTPYTLGCFVGGPEYGPTLMNQVAALVGVMPPIMNIYLDGTQPGLPNTSSCQYGAGQMAANAPWSNKAVIPLIGCPMGTTANSDAQNLAYLQGLAAGQFDAEIANFVTIYADLGYMTQYWRHGVEMNLSSTPGYNSYVGNEAAWIAAFQRIYTVQHAQAAKLGVTLKIIWNPGDCAGTTAGNATKTLYPGDAFCDVIAGDFYGDTQWTNGSVTQAELVASPTLLAEFYTNPAMGDPSQPTVDTSGGVSLPVPALAAFAKARGKPFAMCEVGAGGTPPYDDPVFWTWLRSTLDAFVIGGGEVAFVSLWNSSDPEPYQFTGGKQPLSCAVIANLFGVNAAPIAAAAPPPVAPPVTPPAHAASAAGTQINGATGTIYDTAGNAWTITTGQQIARNGVVVPSSANVVTLFWTGAALDQLNTGGAWWTQPFDGSAGTELTAAPAGYAPPVPPVTITGTTALPQSTFTVFLSADAYEGNAQAAIAIDGKIVATGVTVTAVHAENQWQAFTWQGSYGAGSHTVTVTFLNDQYGGSALLDRNLYFSHVVVDGQSYGAATEMYSTGNTASTAVTTQH